jgi:hypothetical protein
MLRGEPEYRRRIREKREENQRKAQTEEWKAAQERNVEKITAAIHRVKQELNRSNDENQPQRKSDRRWERAGVVGLWAAAAVGTTAIYIGSSDTHKAIEATNGLGQETHRLADEAKRSADDAARRTEIELRAYVGITGDTQLNCPACETDTFRPLTPTPNHAMDNSIAFHLQNGGQTPAYNLRAENSFYPTTYEGTLPENFTFQIYPAAQHLAGIGPETERGVAILNAHDTQPASMSTPLQQDAIALIVQAKHHQISLFWYGNILYTDVFQKSRCTPFCLAYLPDFPRNQQFEPCEKHNTPPKGC